MDLPPASIAIRCLMLSLLLPLLAAPAATASAVDAPRATATWQENAEYERRRKEAGDDVEKLWALHEWCKTNKLEKESRSTLRRIVRLEPGHHAANEALGHVFHEGKWYTSQKQLDEHLKSLEDKEAKAKGLVKYKGTWVPAADVPFLEKGLTKDETGRWVDGEEQRRIQEGWTKQDFEWVSPDDKAHVEKGEWKCGDQWLALDEANKFHSRLDTWWRIPFGKYTVYSTCDRQLVTDKLKPYLEASWECLEKVYGTHPREPVIVVILRNVGQYNTFAGGSEEEQRQGTDSDGLSSIFRAYFADVGFDPSSDGTAFMGAGVTYYDPEAKDGELWGRHSVRHALGHSFAEGLDPSPKAIEKILKQRRPDEKAFWGEKKHPRWLRWGAATYAERYFIDTLVAAGGDSRWAVKWSVSNIVGRGGLRPLKKIFEAEVTVDGGADAEKLINETGLLVSFIVDGNCAPVSEKYKELREAIVEGKDAKAISEAAKALEAEVLKNEAELRKHAGL